MVKKAVAAAVGKTTDKIETKDIIARFSRKDSRDLKKAGERRRPHLAKITVLPTDFKVKTKADSRTVAKILKGNVDRALKKAKKTISKEHKKDNHRSRNRLSQISILHTRSSLQASQVIVQPLQAPSKLSETSATLSPAVKKVEHFLKQVN